MMMNKNDNYVDKLGLGLIEDSSKNAGLHTLFNDHNIILSFAFPFADSVDVKEL